MSSQEFEGVETGDFVRAHEYESPGVEALWVYEPDHAPEMGSPAHPAVALYSAPATGMWVGVAVYSPHDECYKQLRAVVGEETVTNAGADTGAVAVDPRSSLVEVASSLMLAGSESDDPLAAIQDAVDGGDYR